MSNGTRQSARQTSENSDIPRMVSTHDFTVLEHVLSRFGPFKTIVEFGPWLGALSAELAKAGDLHVVDNFAWTKLHAKRLPGLHDDGDSFRPTFERSLADRGLSAVVHETPFESFKWEGPAIDLCVIDAPKKPEDLQVCLGAAQGGLAAGGIVMVKNALYHKYMPMMMYVAALIEAGAFTIETDLLGARSNFIVLRTATDPETLAKILATVDVEQDVDATALSGPMAKLSEFQIGLMLSFARSGDWKLAYDCLSGMQPDRKVTQIWEKLEPDLSTEEVDATQLGRFSEILAVHHDVAAAAKPPKSFKSSLSQTLRAYWIYNADKAWRGRSFDPEIIERAYDYGYVNWPNQVQEYVRCKSVLDVGCGPGLHGLGYLIAGADHYLGIDPIIKPDKDRVKNLSASSAKMPFGWTPNEISERFEAWNVQADPIEDLPEDRIYDIAIMHNVTEHLHQIHEIFAEIAKRLKPGGKLLYNHHNFYSWNGHHLPPKKVSAIDLDDPGQREMIDWGHVEYDPAPEHYIARGLNRIRLDEIIELTERYFDIEVAQERPSRPDTGLGRLTDKIRERYPYLADRDFETQNLFCIAKVKPG